jgi:DNA-binding IclR family transcriptional regulator
VERAARIMGMLFASGTKGKRVTELSEQLGVHKTTVVRLLNTLVAIGVAKKDRDTRRYSWEPLVWIGVVSGARELLERTGMIQAVLEWLAESCDATATVARADLPRGTVTYVGAALRGPPGVDIWHLGASWPAHATACGKVCLAALSEEELDEWMEEVIPGAITSPDKLRRQVARCRKLGYAVQQAETKPSSAVAVPLRNESGEVVGAVEVSVPLLRIKSEQVENWVPLLRGASEKLTWILYVDSEGNTLD